MKKFIPVIVLSMAALVACNKSEPAAEMPDSGERLATLSISIQGTATKAVDPTVGTKDENKVNTIDVFVFNSTNDLDAYAHYGDKQFSTDASGLTTLGGDGISCTVGRGKKVYVVINGDESNVGEGAGYSRTIKKESDLLAQHFLLTQNCQSSNNVTTLDNFQMIGRALNQSFTPGSNTVAVTVSRAVARVKIDGIKRNFATALNGRFLIKKIYMSNAVNSRIYGGWADDEDQGWTNWKAASEADDNSLWYNKYAYDDRAPLSHDYPGYVDISGTADPWLNADMTSSPVELSQGSETEHGFSKVFYVMPNDAPWGDLLGCGPFGGETWSKRHTKLVIETEYAGTTYYYAIPIAKNDVYPIGKDGDDGTGWEGLRSNTTYEISQLVLTKLGSTNPDEPVLPSAANFNISVNAWDTVPMATGDGKYTI